MESTIYNLQSTKSKFREPQARQIQEPRRLARRHRVVSPGRKPWVGRNKLFEPRRREGWHNAHASIYYIAFPSSGFRLRSLRSYAVTGAPYAVTGCHPTIRWGSVCFFERPHGLGLRVCACYALTGRPLTRLHRGLLYAARTCAGSKSGEPAARGTSTLYIVHCTSTNPHLPGESFGHMCRIALPTFGLLYLQLGKPPRDISQHGKQHGGGICL